MLRKFQWICCLFAWGAMQNSWLHTLAEQWAASIAEAERPAPFSYREGSVLRLVPANERLTAPEMQKHIAQLLLLNEQLWEDFKGNINAISSRRRAPRHIAAWARGWCYLQAGNSRQALRDAHTAMAYATAEAPALAPAPEKPPAPSTHPAAAAAAAAAPTCCWVPALLLAAECYAALGHMSPAVVHMAQAAKQAPCNTEVTNRLSALAHQLPLEQAVAWNTGSLGALLQQLQDEAEMKLPEVLRPRQKWYYYNKWMTQRIHTALLELHLGCRLALNGSSSSSSPQQLLETAAVVADAPAIAAAAAAAGFMRQQQAADDMQSTCGQGSSADASSCEALLNVSSKQPLQQVAQFQQGLGQQQAVLQLPAPVVSKLLTLDAGDLDLMIQHPRALQAQVYELLDVLGSGGPQALEQLKVPHLSWQEVQAMAGGDQLVGLPLGYNPAPQQLQLQQPVPAVLASTAAGTPALTEPGAQHMVSHTDMPAAAALEGKQVGLTAAGQLQTGRSVCCVVPASADASAGADKERCNRLPPVGFPDSGTQLVSAGWWQPGLTRSKYLLGAYSNP